MLLVDLLNTDNLTLDLPDLVLSLHVVPKLRFSEDGVLSKDSHSVESGVWNLLTGKASSDDKELSHLRKVKSSIVTFYCIVSTPTPLTISLFIYNEIIILALPY